jgi:hypothetical protein
MASFIPLVSAAPLNSKLFCFGLFCFKFLERVLESQKEDWAWLLNGVSSSILKEQSRIRIALNN